MRNIENRHLGLKVAATSVVAVAELALSATTANAAAEPVNLGHCNAQNVPESGPDYVQAPGITGNGPAVPGQPGVVIAKFGGIEGC